MRGWIGRTHLYSILLATNTYRSQKKAMKMLAEKNQFPDSDYRNQIF